MGERLFANHVFEYEKDDEAQAAPCAPRKVRGGVGHTHRARIEIVAAAAAAGHTGRKEKEL